MLGGCHSPSNTQLWTEHPSGWAAQNCVVTLPHPTPENRQLRGPGCVPLPRRYTLYLERTWHTEGTKRVLTGA